MDRVAAFLLLGGVVLMVMGFLEQYFDPEEVKLRRMIREDDDRRRCAKVQRP